MADSKKQQKNSCDSIKQRGLHVLPPKITAAAYHSARTALEPPTSPWSRLWGLGSNGTESPVKDQLRSTFSSEKIGRATRGIDKFYSETLERRGHSEATIKIYNDVRWQRTTICKRTSRMDGEG